HALFEYGIHRRGRGALSSHCTDDQRHEDGDQRSEPNTDTHQSSPRSPGNTRLRPASASDAVSTPPSRMNVPMGLATAAPVMRAARADTSHIDRPALRHWTSSTHARAVPLTTMLASKMKAAAISATGISVRTAAPPTTPAEMASSDRPVFQNRPSAPEGQTCRDAAIRRDENPGDATRLGSAVIRAVSASSSRSPFGGWSRY